MQSGAVDDGDRAAGELDPIGVNPGVDQAAPGGNLQPDEAVSAEFGCPVRGQGGVRAAVTGSSDMPSAGEKNRETKS